MPKLIVISPKVGHESALALATALNVPYENPYETKKRDYTEYDFVFKYGFSKKIKANKVFNKAKSVEITKNKLTTLTLFKDTPYVVPFTTEAFIAKTWINEGVVARSLVDGHDGDGLSYCWTEEEFNKAPALFWTKYIDHTHEFRVNIWKGKVVSIYEKQKENGFFKFVLFQKGADNPQLVDIVNQVYAKTQIDFCGLDMLRDEEGKLYILELNSAPILFPYTLKKLKDLVLKEIEHVA